MDIVGEVIEIGEPDTFDPLRRARQGDEIDVVDVLRAIAIDEIEVGAADTLDRWDVQLHRADSALHRRRPSLDRELERLAGVAHAEGHGVGRGTVRRAEVGRLTLRLHVEDEVDVALAEPQHVLGAMPRHRLEAHLLEEPFQRLRLRRGELDELEPIGAERIVKQVAGGLKRGVHRRAP